VRGADGIRTKNGEKLSFEYATTRNATRQAIQALVANDLKQVGIDAQQVYYPRGFFDQDGPIATGRTKLAQFAWLQTTTSNFDPWDESQIPTAERPAASNRQQYRNPRVTRANNLFNATVDRKEMTEQSAIAQVELMRDVAVIPLVARPTIELYRNTLVNRKTPDSAVLPWWNISQWYFK
jgi:peptide/nickel transport system substrate-binding protein